MEIFSNNISLYYIFISNTSLLNTNSYLFKKENKENVLTPNIVIWAYMKSSFPKRYKSILIVFMKMTFFYLDPYIC